MNAVVAPLVMTASRVGGEEPKGKTV